MFLPLWLIILLVLFAFFFRHLAGHRKYWRKRGVPGPKSSLLLGHYWALRLPNKGTIRQLREWTRLFGKVYGLYDGPRKILIISDLAMVQELLVTKFDIFEARKLNVLFGLSELNANSILYATSFRWKRLRATSASFFNAINVKKTIPTINLTVQKHFASMHVDDDERPLNIRPLLQRLTDDILVQLVFGDSQANGQPYFELMLQAIEAKAKQPLAKTGNLMTMLLPCTRPAVNWLNSLLASTDHFNEILHKCLLEKVEQRKQQGKGPNGISKFNFLDHLLSLHFDDFAAANGQTFSGKQVNRYLGTNEVVSACANFLYAGHKTLARALSTVIFCLATHLVAQQKLFQEELASFVDGEFSLEQIEKLSFLDMVVREALRLFPLGAEHVARKCMASTTLGGKFQLERGDFVMVDVLSLHSDAALWGPSPERFHPERWLDIAHKNSTQNLSFGQGPRMCLGEKFAVLHMKIVLISLLKKFQIMAVNPTDEWAQQQQLMHNNLLVRLMPHQCPAD